MRPGIATTSSVCGWNSTARELIAELDGDDYDRKIVLIHEADKNPGGAGRVLRQR